VRNPAVDRLRGLAMVLMALDHVRDYVGARLSLAAIAAVPVPLFITRWVTHLCAPTFMFLAGTGAFLSLAAGKPRAEVSRFLWQRGLVLVALEVTVVRFGWCFNLDYRLVWVQVIWALGVSMLVLAALVWLPVWAVGLFGAALVFGHDAFDGVQFESTGPTLLGASARDWVLAVLHVQRRPVIYPLIPWVGVMALGFAFGEVLRLPEARRRRTCVGLGLGAVALFLALRLTGVYGEPRAWQADLPMPGALLSFLDCSKYPPSLCYLLMTLGPMLLALPLLERGEGPVLGALALFGRVPMFYYVAHLYLAHAVAVVVGVATGFAASELLVPFFLLPERYGLPLWGVYAVWAGIVAALYLPCRWYAALKARHPASWLRFV
jgi:uncharacterized membrane protein